MPREDKIELFCRFYALNPNAAEAARRAGYSEKNARDAGWRLLQRQKIKDRIKQLQENAAEVMDLTKARVLQGLLRIAEFDTRKLYDQDNILKSIKNFRDDEALAIAGIEVLEQFGVLGTVKKVKLGDRRAAWDSINRMLGWNAPEKVEVNDSGITEAALANLTREEKVTLLKLQQKMRLGTELVSKVSPRGD